MKNTKRMIRNIILFVLLIIITFSVIFNQRDITEIWKALSSVKLQFIIIAVVFMCFYFVCDAINIGRLFKALGEESKFMQNVKYSLIGFFFSSVTPAASGGQPMQIYYMHKDGKTVANSTLTLLIELTCIQIVTISLAFVSLFFNYQYLNTAMRWCFVIGVGLNSSALALLLISIYSRRLSKWIINFAIKVLRFFKVKNIDQKKEKCEAELARYHDSAIYARNNRPLMLKTLFTTYIQFIIYYSISYWVYLSLGLSEHSILKLITMQSILYATVSGIPSPGAVGVSEGGYIAIFSNIYADNVVNSAMLVNRGINFYLFVLISCVIVSIYTIKDKKEEKANITVEEKPLKISDNNEIKS